MILVPPPNCGSVLIPHPISTEQGRMLDDIVLASPFLQSTLPTNTMHKCLEESNLTSTHMSLLIDPLLVVHLASDIALRRKSTAFHMCVQGIEWKLFEFIGCLGAQPCLHILLHHLRYVWQMSERFTLRINTLQRYTRATRLGGEVIHNLLLVV